METLQEIIDRVKLLPAADRRRLVGAIENGMPADDAGDPPARMRQSADVARVANSLSPCIDPGMGGIMAEDLAEALRAGGTAH
jgi:hypothetical protein